MPTYSRGAHSAGYIDDVIISDGNPEVAASRLLTFLTRANALGWKVSWRKACMGSTSVRFLGNIISKDGRAIDPAKLEALRAIPRPTTLKTLQAYLGFCNFLRSHVIRFADEAGPLLDVLRSAIGDETLKAKPSTKLRWTEEASTAFDRLSRALERGAFLCNFDPSLPLIFYTDASNIGISAVVTQKQGDSLAVIGLESRSLTSAERLYSAFKRQALAVVYALRKWRKHILLPVTFYTDNQGLSFLTGTTGSERIPPSWLDEISLQEITFAWVPGQLNAAADHLSRYPQGVPGEHLGLLDLMELARPAERVAPGADAGSWATAQAFRSTSHESSDEARLLSINSISVIKAIPDSQVTARAARQDRALNFARRTDKASAAADMVVKGITTPLNLSFLPGLFQRVLDDLLKDLPDAAGYIDDVIISGDSPDVVSSRLLTFLGRANDLGWKVSWKKACLGASSVRFLGSIISKDGRAIDPDKVTAFKAIPQPTTLKSLQHDLGFCSFLRVHVIKFAGRPPQRATQPEGGQSFYKTRMDPGGNDSLLPSNRSAGNRCIHREL